MRTVIGIMLLAFWLVQGALAQGAQPLQWSTAWYAAEVEGRTLWMREQSLTVSLSPATQLQVGWQWISTKGRVRTNRFDTSARWFGIVQEVGRGRDTQRLLVWRRLEGEEGVADVAEGRFTYVAPRLEAVALVMRRAAGHLPQEYRAAFSRLRAGTESAQTWSLGWGGTFDLGSDIALHVDASLYADRHNDTAYRTVFHVALSQPLGNNLRARVGAHLAPRGFPLSGTPLEGLTAFSVYRPGGLIDSWGNRTAGYFYLRVDAGLR